MEHQVTCYRDLPPETIGVWSERSTRMTGVRHAGGLRWLPGVLSVCPLEGGLLMGGRPPLTAGWYSQHCGVTTKNRLGVTEPLLPA